MKRRIRYPIVLMMALMLPAGFGATTTQADIEKKVPESLYVITAKTGEITPVGDHQYRLTMKHTDVDHVLMFSDRPYRTAQYITAEELAQSWRLGKNSFEKDPPNAALVAHGLKQAIAIELLSTEVDESQVSFRFTSLQNEQMMSATALVGVSLFIDDGTGHPNCGSEPPSPAHSCWSKTEKTGWKQPGGSYGDEYYSPHCESLDGYTRKLARYNKCIARGLGFHAG